MRILAIAILWVLSVPALLVTVLAGLLALCFAPVFILVCMGLEGSYDAPGYSYRSMFRVP